MQTEQDLEKLVHAHTAALLRYCTGLLGCEADAQDAVQKTFIKAWQQRRTLRGDGTDNECAWLYRIAYRTSLDMLRAYKRALVVGAVMAQRVALLPRLDEGFLHSILCVGLAPQQAGAVPQQCSGMGMYELF